MCLKNSLLRVLLYNENMKNWIYLLILVIEIIGLSLMDPITQNFDYHRFADDRTILGITNFWDVASNIPFLIIGSLGISYVLKNFNSIPSSYCWLMVFIGVFLVAPGSSYYHLMPKNWTLVWDRLPMTIGFMAITSALFSYKMDKKKEIIVLTLCLALGFFSIWYWVYMDDLRVYFFVQLTPILLVPIFAFIEKDLKIVRKYLLGAFAFYFLAKVVEKYDVEIFDHFLLSGHTIKHLLAAAATYCFYKMCICFKEQNFKKV